MNGLPVNSCLVLGVEAEGAKIETVEGLAQQGHLHPLQQCFLEGAALQCGICTPGFLVAAKALLDKNPNPSEHEIRFNLANNLCRCTGYDKIVRAVQAAAKELAGEVAKLRMQGTRTCPKLQDLYLGKKQYSVLGQRPVRHDGADKVTGKAIYTADLHAAEHGARQDRPQPACACEDQDDRRQRGLEAARRAGGGHARRFSRICRTSSPMMGEAGR